MIVFLRPLGEMMELRMIGRMDLSQGSAVAWDERLMMTVVMMNGGGDRLG